MTNHEGVGSGAGEEYKNWRAGDAENTAPVTEAEIDALEKRFEQARERGLRATEQTNWFLV